MDEEIDATIVGCTSARRRLDTALLSLADEVARRPSLLPRWTVGHLLAHLARTTDSHVRMPDTALAGQAVEQYAGGRAGRCPCIAGGRSRSTASISAWATRPCRYRH